MKRLLSVVFITYTLFALSGCVTWMTSEKATDSGRGIRYSLPQPFLLVTPKADGTMLVETVMLPDPQHTYTLRQKSILAAHTLDVSLENGMLTTVTLNGDSSALAKETIGAVGELQKAQLDAEIAAAKAEAETAKATQQKVVDTKAALDKATTLRAYLEEYVATNPSDEAAKLELLKANIAERQAQADYVAARSAAEALGLPLDPSGFNDPGTAAAGGPSAYTPLLYRVIQTGDSVELKAVKIGDSSDVQAKIPTSTLSLPEAPTPPKFAISPAEKIVVLPQRLIEITANQAVKHYDANRSAFNRIRNGASSPHPTKPDVVLQGLTLQVGLPNDIRPGDYTFAMYLSTKKNGLGGVLTDLKIRVR